MEGRIRVMLALTEHSFLNLDIVSANDRLLLPTLAHEFALLITSNSPS